MVRKRLPLRPNTSTRYALTEEERYALCCYCVFECTKLDVFKLSHPSVVGTKNVLKSQAEQFFATSDVVNFIREYKQMLEEAEKAEKTEKPKHEYSGEEWESKKQRALLNLAQKGYRLTEDLDSEDADVEMVVKVLDKLGWLDSEEETPEQPRRYLPETCSQCRYKKWIEENCEEVDDSQE